MSTCYCLVLSTCPDADSARRIAEVLVSSRLAACVNILPGLTSVYRWQGDIEASAECLLLIKTESALFDTLSARIRELHPYELPEVIAVPIGQGLPDYLAWVGANVCSEA